MTTHEVAIRRANDADAKVVARLLHDFNAEFDSAAPSADEFAERFTVLLRGEDVAVLVAESPDGAVGFAFLTLRPTPYFDGPLAQLEELYVRPAWRDRGVGGSLLRAAVHTCEAHSAAEIHINVDAPDRDARRFYERHGFSNLDPDSAAPMLCYLREL